MALSEKQSDAVATLFGLSLFGFIALNIYDNYQTYSIVMNEITEGLIPTAAGGVNNPGNIRTSTIPWLGKITPEGSAFEQFQDMWHGYRALIDTLKAHYNRYGQTTLNLFMAGNANGPGYARASDNNNPGNEAAYAANNAGISPDEDLGPYLNNAAVLNKIVAGIAQFEQGQQFIPNPADITLALNNLGIS